LKNEFPFFLANEPATGANQIDVLDKFTGEVATRVHSADSDAIDRAIALAVEAEEPMRKLSAHQRQAVLKHCVQRFTERKDELADSLCVEAGKPIKDSRGEVARLIDTFAIAAEESVRILGEVIPLDRTPAADGRIGFTRRIPIGACSFISPFNFPLNLAAGVTMPTPSPKTPDSNSSASPARPASAGISKAAPARSACCSNSAATPHASSTAASTWTTASRA